jgi:hypothetical protein
MYEVVLFVHSLWRWVVLSTGTVTVASALWSYRLRAPWGATARLGRLFAIAVDIQFLMGASLYLVFSPMTTVAMGVASGLPAGSELRFFGVYHGLIMTAAFLDVHVSAVIVRRGKDDPAKLRRSALLYGQTLLVIACAIPWWRPWFRA